MSKLTEKKDNKKKKKQGVKGSTVTLLMIFGMLFSFMAGMLFTDVVKNVYPDYYKYEQIDKISNQIADVAPRVDPVLVDEMAEGIYDASKKYHIPKDLILAVMYCESRFNPFAHSSKGAVGLMQIMPGVHKNEYNHVNDLYHVKTNIDIGVRILRRYIDQTGSASKALLRYVGSSDYKAYVYKVCSTVVDWKVETHNKVEKSIQKKDEVQEAKVEVKYHNVNKGETLSILADKYDTTVSDLRKINGMDQDETLILVGQKLRVSS